MRYCYACGSELDVAEKVARGDTCWSCGTDLKVCRNCVFYDELSYNECREPQAERELQKNRANFCDYFRFGSQAKKQDSTKGSVRQQLDALFKK